jgi:hypothetical protein
MAARTIYGLIGGGGEILSGSADFTVQRVEVGLYTVFFNRSFSAQPAVIVSQVYPSDIDSAGGSTLDNAVVVGITPERFRVKTGDPSGAASDRSFAFLAIGG